MELEKDKRGIPNRQIGSFSILSIFFLIFSILMQFPFLFQNESQNIFEFCNKILIYHWFVKTIVVCTIAQSILFNFEEDLLLVPALVRAENLIPQAIIVCNSIVIEVQS